MDGWLGDEEVGILGVIHSRPHSTWSELGATASLIDHKGTHWAPCFNSLQALQLGWTSSGCYFIFSPVSLQQCNPAHLLLRKYCYVNLFWHVKQLFRVEGNEGGLKNWRLQPLLPFTPHRHVKGLRETKALGMLLGSVHHRWRRFSPAGILRGHASEAENAGEFNSLPHCGLQESL